MGKRITQQARGKGSLTFKVKKKAYRYKLGYPKLSTEGKAKIVTLFNSPGHSAPLIKIKIDKEVFISPAADGICEGQEIMIGGKEAKVGNILRLKDMPIGTKVSNLEKSPGSGGKFLRSAGSSGLITSQNQDNTEITVSKRRKILLHKNCRASVGALAGEGRLIKPVAKAGKKHHIMLAQGRKWHRTSAVKVNAVDHPFGGGRGKRIKSKIAKRNSPPGRKVGHIRPKQTGRK
jgi:large subunit ribosomal protein L2